MKKAVIIIPTYNERENIAMIVPRIFQAVKKVNHYHVQILVVDDTSPDKTYQTVKKMQSQFADLKLLVNAKKAGLGGAYLAGMKEAFGKLKADYVFEFDADGSHDPTKLPEFFAKLDEGYDLVIGGRYRHGGSIDPNWPLIRKFYSIVGNFTIMLVLGDFRIGDWTSGYRAISKRVWEAILPEMDNQLFTGYTWQIGFLHKTVRRKFQVTEVPIYFVDRKIGESKLGSEYIKNTLIYIFKARFEEIIRHRLFKFAVTGGIGTMVQLISFYLMQTFVAQNDTFVQIANFISIEFAIISNFIINGRWTFADRKLEKKKLLPKFVQFNLASVGSVAIQMLIMFLGLRWWGNNVIARPFGTEVTMASLYQLVGILFGLTFNYFFYTKLIWKKKTN